MRFSALLFVLAGILRFAAWFNREFRKFIRPVRVRILIKTADNRRGRLFVFDRGKVSTRRGAHADHDAALVFSDPAAGFSVLTDKRPSASFDAAADGKLRVEGMSIYAQWFEQAMNRVI
ncbi:MAG: hypothetical protein ACLFUY_02190 [Desulfobacterales bacterium]